MLFIFSRYYRVKLAVLLLIFTTAVCVFWKFNIHAIRPANKFMAAVTQQKQQQAKLPPNFPLAQQELRLLSMDIKGSIPRQVKVFTPSQPAQDAKYFYEHRKHHHMDRRYSKDEPIPSDKRLQLMRLLLKEYFGFMDSHNATSWIAHGTLLGWFWNQQILPWDDDIDVQMTFDQMTRLHALNFTRTGANNRYLFEINPNYIYRYRQLRNRIDARFIDTETGMFIDITAVAEIGKGMLSCKSPHYYLPDDLFPLHRTLMEGVHVWRPNRVIPMLVKEYGHKSVSSSVYYSYVFNHRQNKWLFDKSRAKIVKSKK